MFVSVLHFVHTAIAGTSDALQPDDCRKLLAGVGPVVGVHSDMLPCTPAIDSGVIANEQPGNIRTVHRTEKVLVAHETPECSGFPEEVIGCNVNCLSEHARADASEFSAAAKDEVSDKIVHHSIPLLMWSPGRRQQSQRAV